MQDYKTFRFWCQKVLPLVYDDSLSYYETLCKVVDYLNHMLADNQQMSAELEQLAAEVQSIQKWIDEFDPVEISKIIQNYICRGVYFGLTDNGYFTAYIPNTWYGIDFRTTGLDFFTPVQPNYGHLVLRY